MTDYKIAAMWAILSVALILNSAEFGGWICMLISNLWLMFACVTNQIKRVFFHRIDEPQPPGDE